MKTPVNVSSVSLIAIINLDLPEYVKTNFNLEQKSSKKINVRIKHKVFDQFICLLVKKSKSFKYKIIFNFWGWKVRPNATNCTWRENNSYLLPLKSPAQPCQLPVSYVPLLFVIWTFIGISVLLFILIPYSLKTPPIQANCAKPWVLRNTHWRFVKSFGLDCFIVFSPPHSEFQNTIRIQPL